MVVGEASVLATGFSTYSLELLKRLHASGLEVCEYGCYVQPADERTAGLPWRFLSAMPHRGDEEGHRLLAADPANQFGALRFEEACLAFRPDVVLSWRDHWMDEFIERSPFRRFFRFIWMPTVDAEPQDRPWVSTMRNADGLFAYNDWSAEVIRRQAGAAARLFGSAPPGADLDSFKVVADRRSHRAAHGMDPDALVVGTVMRNQSRKRYPELLRDFALFLAGAPRAVAQQAYLYVHAAWPDVGWDLPRLLLENGLSSRVLFSYHCRACGGFFPSFFADASTFCKLCGKPAACFPNTQLGLSRAALGRVYSLFDCYVQYASSEGFGLPIMEAAACGVPVMAVDYSAMSDVVRKLAGTPIRPAAMVREPETHCWRATPDGADFVAKLSAFLRLPESARRSRGYLARRGAELHYNWDETASRWMKAIEAMPPAEPWSSPARFVGPAPETPPGLSNEEFVGWGMSMAGRADLADSYLALKMLRDLNWGGTPDRGRLSDYGREQALSQMKALAARHNEWEARRCR